MSTKTTICPHCKSRNTRKRGVENNIQTYSCNSCHRRFRNKRKHKKHVADQIWFDYVFHKQTIRELLGLYDLDKKTIYKYLQEYTIEDKNDHNPRPINLVVDATYFGKRLDSTSWGVILFRDQKNKENLWWKFVDTESSYGYREGKEFLESKGYTILSVTCDGFKGNINVFKGILLQMCHFHMKQIVIRNISLRPKTESGKVLLALVKEIPNMTENVFMNRLKMFWAKYYDFLLEKTYHPEGDWSYTHEGVLNAYRSLEFWSRYLFTYHRDRNIPNTTNTCDGHFSHVKDIVRIHRGITKIFKQKVITSIFKENSIAPLLKKKKRF